MRLRDDREIGIVGVALMASAIVIAFAATAFPSGKVLMIPSIAIGMMLLTSGVFALAGASGLTSPRRSIPGILVPGAAWGVAAVIACCAPWRIMVALHPAIGPSAMPLAVAASLCGTAGAILAGRWADLAINAPPEEETKEETKA